MKKIISLGLLVCILSSMSIGAFADESFNDPVYAVFTSNDGTQVELTKNEFDDMLTRQQPIGITYSYDEDSSKSYTYTDYSKRAYVSDIAEGPMTISAEYSKSVSAEFSFSINKSAQNAVIGNVDVSCGLSLSSAISSSSGASYNVPAGMYARITWTPNYYHTEGTLNTELLLVTGILEVIPAQITAELPVKRSNGMADGVFGHVVSSNMSDLYI